MLFNHLYLNSPGVDLIQAIVRMPEAVDAALLEQAWQTVVQRHAVLRTSFEWEELERPIQHVHAACSISMDVDDLRSLRPTDQDRVLQEYLRQDSQRGFDLQRAPLIRLHLFQLEDCLFK